MITLGILAAVDAIRRQADDARGDPNMAILTVCVALVAAMLLWPLALVSWARGAGMSRLSSWSVCLLLGLVAALQGVATYLVAGTVAWVGLLIGFGVLRRSLEEKE